MAIKGSLKEAGLADVCQLLALGQKTGSLSVADGSRFGQIFFDRGRITYARIVNRRDRLGDILVRDGLLTQAQLERVLERQAREPDVRIGELLVAHGHLTREILTRYIRLQIEEAIYHLFTWSRGSFFFEVDARPDAADVIVSINPESLLIEAARRVDEWSVIEQKIPHMDLVFDIARDRVEQSEAELTPEQKRILQHIDGSRTVQELVDRSGLTEFAVGKALFGFIQAGFARPLGRRTEEVVRGREAELHERRNLGVAFYRTNMFDDAQREFQRVLDLDPSDFSTRYHLALIFLHQRRFRLAVRQLRLLVQEAGPHYGAFVNMSLALRSLGRYEDALLALDEAESLRPTAPQTQLARGITLLHAHSFAEARAAFEQYRARLGAGAVPATEYYYYASLVLALQEDLNGADQLLAEGMDVHPDAAPLLLLAGVIAERRGDLSGADRLHRRSLEIDGTIPQAHKNLGDVAYRRAEHQEALQHYLRAAQLEPNLGDDVFARIGNLLYKKQRVDAAVGYWRKALQLNPGNEIVRANLENAAHASG
jgi:tetratricopeptide (TPR) repeat protein